MGKQVAWTTESRTDVRAIDRNTALRILIALDRFLQTGAGDVKQLEGYDPPLFRFRVGDYRVMYRPRGNTIDVVRVLHRSEAYR